MEDVFIRRDGHILRGPEATEELLGHDVADIIREAGLESLISSPTNLTENGACDNPLAATHADSDDLQDSNSVEETGRALMDQIITNAGPMSRIKLKLKKLIIPTKVNVFKTSGKVMAGSVNVSPEVTASAQCANVNAATLSGNVVNLDVSEEVGASLNALTLKTMTASVTGTNIRAHASGTATAKAADAKLCNADVTGVDCTVEAEVVATAKGADIKVGSAKITGVQETERADAQAVATGLDKNSECRHNSSGLCI